ncbi:alpha/beta hydrolase [Amycolatopsis sp. GA6-003]|uniref:alpha/beta hydrolase n=1 Tax=Amycolatopsis sp. GA6-003 TaxID=2652444 RepID=UPI0039171A83
MVSLADVRAWDPGVLDEVCSGVQAKVQVLTNEGDDYGKLLPVDGWSGPAAEGAAAQHKTHMQGLDTYVAGAAAIGKAVGQAADAVLAVQAAIKNADELARKYGFAITADGAIACVYGGDPPPELHPQDRARAQQQLADDIAQILRTAEDIDSDLAAVLDKAAAGQFGTGNESTVAAAAADGLKAPGMTFPEPPPNATPAQNAAWWATLPASARDALIRDRPSVIGAMDGLPAVDRDKANRVVLDRDYADLRRQRDDLQHRMDGLKMSDPQQQNEHHDLQVQLDALNEKISSLDAVHDTLAKGNRQLLFLDSTHPRVEAAIAVGDVDKAANVAVFTPGFTTTVNGDLAQYDTNMDDMKRMADRIDFRHGGGPTAAVTWIGYQAPQWSGIANPDQSVLTPHAAQAGGESLAKFYNGIGAGHEASNTPLHLTALGHSYGSSTTGYALSHDTPVQDAMLFGSPGQGAEHLKVPQGHLFAAQDAGDTLVPNYGNTGVLGPSPYFSPDASNYHQMSTDASLTEAGPLNATEGHSGYLDAQSTSMYNMAAITTGHPDLAQYKGTVLAEGPR